MRLTPKRLASATSLAAALCVFGAAAHADDDDYGAYMFKGTCDAYAANTVVKDVGDLELEDDGDTEEWSRVAPDGAAMPADLRAEDESTSRITADDLAAGGFALAVTRRDEPDTPLIACVEFPQGITLPHVSDLAEVDGSGVAGRVAIEERGNGVRITTTAFAKDAVPPLPQE
ncbi:hypothetical protein [Pontibaca methylaminivorans]|uniref:hypothetical protein n=1 Tax=Pontibaca methylaminivorans TaxID=515897 RepID=UPI002FDB9212